MSTAGERSDPAPHRLDSGGSTALTGMRLLAWPRSVAPAFLAVTQMLVPSEYRGNVDYGALALLLLSSSMIALVTWWYITHVSNISEWALFGHAHLDIALFTAMLYITGGTSNPFAPLFLFLLPMAITAAALRPWMLWTTVVSTMLAYWFVRGHGLSLYEPNSGAELFKLHKDGMLANYVITAAVLAFFATSMIGAISRRERQLAAARSAQMRNESVVAIGALAAGYAHELGSPLGTMAVLVGELKRTHGTDPGLSRDLDTIESQLDLCKRTVSSLTHAAERRRAEAGGSAPLHKFLASVVARVRTLRSDATIDFQLDDATPPPLILAEETLRQAITNLVDNAVRASPNDVSFHATWGDGLLRITVRDRGPGFPAELLASLGQNIQPENSRTGLGVGLMLSAAIFESLGGQLQLHNSPSGGAVCEVQIPLQSILVDTRRTSDDH
jgi:two-component system, sensor histidine kinase RegB